jgi:predicted DNA-binding protein (UPF0251 family)
VHCEPGFNYFKPRGVPLAHLEHIKLGIDEFEAIRLRDLQGLEQTAAAEKMHISQPTFHRTLESARKKVADALVNGKAIRIQGGNYKINSTSQFICEDCGFKWDEPRGTGRPNNCPRCSSTLIHRD